MLFEGTVYCFRFLMVERENVFGTYLVFRSHEMVTGRNFEFFVIFRQTVAGAVLDHLIIMKCFVSCNSMKNLNIVKR